MLISLEGYINFLTLCPLELCNIEDVDGRCQHIPVEATKEDHLLTIVGYKGNQGRRSARDYSLAHKASYVPGTRQPQLLPPGDGPDTACGREEVSLVCNQ